DFYNRVLNLKVTYNDQNYTYEDLCARRPTGCAVDGNFIFESFFKEMMEMGAVTYPVWAAMTAVDLNLYISDVKLTNGDSLVAAGSLKLIFPLRQDNPEIEKVAKAWELEYVEFMKKQNFSSVDYAFAVSQSLSKELDKGTHGDIIYFCFTFTIMITFASIVSSGGDCVSTRALMANAGVIGVVFGIMGAFGVVTLCGVPFVNIVGVMPFLTLGIGVDDMFLLMGSWSETLSLPDLTVPERMGTVFKKAGIGITITSGVGVLFCYVCNASVFGACLAIHGRRVYSKRHVVTCQKVEKSRKELSESGHSCCYVCLCGGKIPESPDEEQSVFEKGPRKALVIFLMWTPVRIIVLLVFAGYLAVSIWGCTILRQGLDLKDLVLPSSYFHKYQIWDSNDFGVKIPIAFVTTTPKEYWDTQTVIDIMELLETARKDPLIDPLVDSCWLTTLAKSPLYNTSSEEAFYDGLHEFLTKHEPRFYNDLAFGDDNRTIVASRCHAYTRKVTDSTIQAHVMSYMREVADASPAKVFAFHPAFVYFEQYVEVWPSTLQTIGVTLAVMLIATSIFLPHPLMVMLVMIQVVMIVVGVFGFMGIWDLTLSSVTMIHLIMSVGFSVDFCAHVCTAYMVSEQTSRHGRAKDAIVHASSPIFSGGISSLLGIILLLFTESYIFQSFFKITLLVIGFGMVHAVLLVPVVLSFIGPGTHVEMLSLKKESDTPNRSGVATSARNGVELVRQEELSSANNNSNGNAFKNAAFEADAHLGYLPA
ncbi:unnamed protein product, partial [Candidula unifasciata]